MAGLIQTTTAPVAVALKRSNADEDLPLLCFRTSCAVNTSDLDVRGKSAAWGACVAAALHLLGSSVRHALHPPSAWQAEQEIWRKKSRFSSVQTLQCSKGTA